MLYFPSCVGSYIAEEYKKEDSSKAKSKIQNIQLKDIAYHIPFHH